MILYHFTCREHLDKILSDQNLRVTESNISGRREHAGPDVVWLTTNPDPSAHGHGLAGSATDKTAIRFTVELDKRNVHKWRDWAAGRGIDRGWMQILASAGGSSTWRVVERPIPAAQWVEICDTETGRQILADYLRTGEGASG